MDSPGSIQRLSRRFLRSAAVLFAVAFVVHGLDHAVRGMTGDDHHTVWSGTFQVAMGGLTVVIAAVVVFLVFTDHYRAPLVSAVVGFVVAIFFLLVHGLPNWTGLADSFVSAPTGARVTEYSWVTASLGILASAVLAIAGLHASRTSTHEGSDTNGM